MNLPILLALNSTQWVILIVLLLFVLVILGIFAQFASLWLQCKMTRAGIGLGDLVFMQFRRVNPALIVRSKIMAVQAGLN
ncbi:MAG: flotillin-like FloA family protein, partial [Planctomycetaceae bacterium]